MMAKRRTPQAEELTDEEIQSVANAVRDLGHDQDLDSSRLQDKGVQNYYNFFRGFSQITAALVAAFTLVIMFGQPIARQIIYEALDARQNATVGNRKQFIIDVLKEQGVMTSSDVRAINSRLDALDRSHEEIDRQWAALQRDVANLSASMAQESSRLASMDSLLTENRADLRSILNRLGNGGDKPSYPKIR